MEKEKEKFRALFEPRNRLISFGVLTSFNFLPRVTILLLCLFLLCCGFLGWHSLHYVTAVFARPWTPTSFSWTQALN